MTTTNKPNWTSFAEVWIKILARQKGVEVGKVTVKERTREGHYERRAESNHESVREGGGSMKPYAEMTEEERERRIYRGQYFRPTHGMTFTGVYELWKRIRKRCHNPNDPDYRRYGGRGITVCSEWEDPKTFMDWALANGYQRGLSLDRIDNNKGYSPENCRFTDQKTQSRNRENNHVIEYQGESHCLSEWAEIMGISAVNIRNRLKLGWSVENALTIKPSPHTPKGKYNHDNKN